jgi:hypothetical protein
MRLSGRSLLSLGLVVSSAVVTLFACGVDQEAHLPGLPNALPNKPGGAGFTAGLGTDGGVGGGSGFGGAGGSFGVGGGSTSSGPALSLCDVVAGSNVAGSACANCINASVTGACLTAKTNCQNDALCQSAAGACAGCGQLDSCIEQCLDMSSIYQELVSCEDQQCGQGCGHSPPLTCTITDGG